ncbi:hypothetical protein KO495_13210 [Colwellia sp. D2M02]|uniref:Uncharacterized protein n=1 Tax=Colwellia asteriadis TaxID=517723 RepID=A0ABN1L595_9GAMM|nr:hypothetical protein [Colwellia sp. D2M02]MBU2894272.1 hypothetical protein [Colwellia sp. D2M02]
MEWLQSILSKEILILFVSVIAMIGVFIFAARRAHLNHLKRMKEINSTFNPEDKSLT